jgi:ribosomal protein S21
MSQKGNKVLVQDGNVEKALRKLKKKVSDDNLLLDLQNKQFFVKPAIKRKLAKKQAVKRWKRFLASQELPKQYY